VNIFYVSNISDPSEQYLKKLQKLPVCKEMIVLSKKSFFLSPMAIKLRCGDLLLLFIRNIQEFNELHLMEDMLSDFRIILILDNADHETFRQAHLLRPSFIAFTDEEIMTIEAVIKKVTQISFFPQDKQGNNHD